MFKGNSSSAIYDIVAVIDDAKKVIMDPFVFYEEMSTTGGYISPIIFVVAMTLVTVVITFAFSIIGIAKFNPLTGSIVTFSMVVTAPIKAVISTFIISGIAFGIWRLMGSEKNYEAAVHCVAYTFAIGPLVALVAFIPYLPSIIKTLWATYLLYIASLEVHKVNDHIAKIVFGVLATIGVLLNASGEQSKRHIIHQAEHSKALAEHMTKHGPFSDGQNNLEDMSPEEAGRRVNNALKNTDDLE